MKYHYINSYSKDELKMFSGVTDENLTRKELLDICIEQLCSDYDGDKYIVKYDKYNDKHLYYIGWYVTMNKQQQEATMIKYLNMKTNYGTETVDDLDSRDFQTPREFRAELRRLVNEYHLCGMNVYISSRPDKTWNK